MTRRLVAALLAGLAAGATAPAFAAPDTKVCVRVPEQRDPERDQYRYCVDQFFVGHDG